LRYLGQELPPDISPIRTWNGELGSFRAFPNDEAIARRAQTIQSLITDRDRFQPLLIPPGNLCCA
jgi:hypothetical protein